MDYKDDSLSHSENIKMKDGNPTTCYSSNSASRSYLMVDLLDYYHVVTISMQGSNC